MSHDIQTLELTIEQAKKSVELMKKLERLHKNRDFKAIIEDELFNEYAKTLTLMVADPSLQSPEDQKDLNLESHMVGRFRQYLSSIFQKGRLAEKSILDSEAELDELRAEGADE